MKSFMLKAVPTIYFHTITVLVLNEAFHNEDFQTEDVHRENFQAETRMSLGKRNPFVAKVFTMNTEIRHCETVHPDDRQISLHPRTEWPFPRN